METSDLNFEYQYALGLEQLMKYGVRTENRTGIDTLVKQHQYFYLKDIEFNFPMLKGKKLFPKLNLKELIWQLHGFTDVKWLQARGVNYWNNWQDTNGTIGKSYGYQMRNFNGIDQLENLITNLITNPISRRKIICLWNPADLEEMTLEPCVFLFQFNCIPNGKNQYYVDLHVTQRSGDSFLGVPYDIMFDAWFLKTICTFTNGCLKNIEKTIFIPRDVHHTINDFHLYVNHIDQAKEYLSNTWENKFDVINQKVSISLKSESFTTIDAFLDYCDICDYQNYKVNKFYQDQYDTIKAKVAI